MQRIRNEKEIHIFFLIRSHSLQVQCGQIEKFKNDQEFPQKRPVSDQNLSTTSKTTRKN